MHTSRSDEFGCWRWFVFPVVIISAASVIPSIARAQGAPAPVGVAQGTAGPGMARQGMIRPGIARPAQIQPGYGQPGLLRNGAGRPGFGPGFGPGPARMPPAFRPSSVIGPRRYEAPARRIQPGYINAPDYRRWWRGYPYAGGYDPYWDGGYSYGPWNRGNPFAGFAGHVSILADQSGYYPGACYRALRPVVLRGRWSKRWVTVCQDG